MQSLPSTLSSVWHLSFRDHTHTCHCLPLTRWAGTALLRKYAHYGHMPSAQPFHLNAAAVAGPSGRTHAAAASSGHLNNPFYSPAEVSLASLGYHKAVTDALHAATFDRPSQVQALAAAPIAAGTSVVLAAETGSGKTLAYLAPLISSLLSQQDDAESKADPANGRETDSRASDGVLVLCPNAALCNQVVAFADALKSNTGAPLVRAAHVSSQLPLPRQLPDIVAATPAALMAATGEYGQFAGWEWTKEGIVARMRHVVLDEADLLLTGGYERDTKRILSAFREGDRARSAGAAAAKLGLGAEQMAALPRHMRRAAEQGGADGLLGAKGFEAPMPLDWDGGVGAAAPSSSSGERSGAAAEASTSGRGFEEAERRFRGRTWQRQYLFVAATMPSGAGSSVAGDLRRMFPDLIWLSGNSLHMAQARVAHTWLPVTADSWQQALQDAILGDEEMANGRTLVFASNVAAAAEVATSLAAAGLQPLLYHRDVPAADRAAALETMRGRTGSVMVCTDAAARGIDIPAVTHVLQASFAASAVDFLHRVGRTGRAGTEGKVTSLYLPHQAILAEAIRAAMEAGQPVEGAFSRNRSFAKKVRKYGKYVPRGHALQRG